MSFIFTSLNLRKGSIVIVKNSPSEIFADFHISDDVDFENKVIHSVGMSVCLLALKIKNYLTEENNSWQVIDTTAREKSDIHLLKYVQGVHPKN